jgi:hypothetical protein
MLRPGWARHLAFRRDFDAINDPRLRILWPAMPNERSFPEHANTLIFPNVI